MVRHVACVSTRRGGARETVRPGERVEIREHGGGDGGRTRGQEKRKVRQLPRTCILMKPVEVEDSVDMSQHAVHLHGSAAQHHRTPHSGCGWRCGAVRAPTQHAGRGVGGGLRCTALRALRCATTNKQRSDSRRHRAARRCHQARPGASACICPQFGCARPSHRRWSSGETVGSHRHSSSNLCRPRPGHTRWRTG